MDTHVPFNDPASTSAKNRLADSGGRADMGRLELAAFGLLFVVFASLAIFVVFHHNLNWDEFHFLKQIYEYDQNQLRLPLQTFHVHLLCWLLWLPLGEVGQLLLGRALMLTFFCGGILALYLMAMRLFDVRTALLVVALYIASGFAIEHGASFRTDPVVLFALMTSLAILMIGRLEVPSLLLAGLLGAVGLLVSIKGVFYFPAFLGAFIWRSHAEGLRFALCKFSLAAVFFLLAFVALWIFHTGSLAVASPLQSSSSYASAAGSKTILSSDHFPRAFDIVIWAKAGLLTVLAIVGGVFISLTETRGGHRARAIAMLLCALPLATLVFYRNAFPYFFPFILAPVMLVTAPLLQRYAKPGLTIIAALGCMLTIIAAAPHYLDKDQQAQRETIAAVKMAFPDPVGYIDRAGMIPSYKKRGFFMTSWGMEGAIASGRDVLTDTIHTYRPPLLIANAPSLAFALYPEEVAKPSLRLSRTDEATLRENYVHHWGAIWVAGKRMDVGPAQTRFAMLIAGVYTVQCSVGEIVIDDQPVACGGTVQMSREKQTIIASRPGEVILKYGDNLSTPAFAPSQKPIFYSL